MVLSPKVTRLGGLGWFLLAEELVYLGVGSRDLLLERGAPPLLSGCLVGDDECFVNGSPMLLC